MKVSENVNIYLFYDKYSNRYSMKTKSDRKRHIYTAIIPEGKRTMFPETHQVSLVPV